MHGTGRRRGWAPPRLGFLGTTAPYAYSAWHGAPPRLSLLGTTVPYAYLCGCVARGAAEAEPPRHHGAICILVRLRGAGCRRGWASSEPRCHMLLVRCMARGAAEAGPPRHHGAICILCGCVARGAAEAEPPRNHGAICCCAVAWHGVPPRLGLRGTTLPYAANGRACVSTGLCVNVRARVCLRLRVCFCDRV